MTRRRIKFDYSEIEPGTPEKGKIGSIYELVPGPSNTGGLRFAWEHENPGDWPDEIFDWTRLLYLGNGKFLWIEEGKKINIKKTTYNYFDTFLRLVSEAE